MATGHWPALKERKIKKNFIRFISILFLITFFVSCKSTQVESNSTENHNNEESLVLYDRDAQEAYYLEDKKEIKKVLKLLPKFPNIVYDIIYAASWGTNRPDSEYWMYIKKSGKVQKEIDISPKDLTWHTHDSFLTLWVFPRKNIKKIISKMHKGVKHTPTIIGALEQRQFIEELRADDNVIYIDRWAEKNFDDWSGSFYLYVPGYKDEKINSREIVDNLSEHYGDTKTTLGKAIHNYSDPELKRYIEETQEYEFKMRWTKEMYDKVDIYRKSEFRSESPALHDTIEYYTKDY